MSVTDSRIFETRIRVRDYELDAQGIVNNANYLHYLEVTRHEFCEQAGMSFGEMTARGIIAVLKRIEVEYINSLRSGDTMISRLSLHREGARFVFHQWLDRASDGAPVVDARVSIVVVENGRLTRGDSLAEAFAEYL